MCLIDPMSILAHGLIATAACILVYASMKEGMIFFPLRQKLDDLLHRPYLWMIAQPIYECLTCMCSVWGTIYYFTIMAGDDPSFRGWILLVIATGGFNFMASAVISFFEFHKMMEENERDPS